MIVEVRGTGVHNKGAELMLCAIRQYFAEAAPHVQLAVSPHFGPYGARARYGLLTKLPQRRKGRSLLASWAMSRSFRRTYGIVADDEIDAVLDASGFAFGDQWGPGPSEHLAKEVARRAGTNGKPFVLLPQALGPFKSERVRHAFREALNHVSAVFARDTLSLEYARELAGPIEVRQAPDFTTIVPGRIPPHVDLPERFACVVPNIRMLDQTTADDREAYVGFLANAVKALQQHAVEPLLLFHDPKYDQVVAAQLQQHLGRKLPVVEDADPIHLKGVIGQATAVIGSRFHALVGALSQGVPAIAAGWSHKYDMLFEEYGCERFVVSPSDPWETHQALMDEICGDASQSKLRTHLNERARVLRTQARTMLDDVVTIIGA